ncbi:protein AF1q [Seriola lalandi dorsalis]|uniref:Protein AF1q n=1 Tax=Seriola lalandi dorsalis TaxID=1841481 RepID=A0A3B4WSN7_SERLL|nr:protein AF1q [Seriola lalandi dorsalis]XP_056256341.1 protein AF1q [Seriola aureovittata]
MMEKSNSQYDSFLFWRQPIPALDLSELEDLGLINGPANGNRGKDKMCKLRSQDEEVELSEFSSFNYWRAPIADVDTLLADLNLLL